MNLFKTMPHVAFGRAEKWLDSALLGFANGILWLPTGFWQTTKKPILQIVLGLADLAVTLPVFFLTRALVLIGGLAGFVVPSPSRKGRGA